MLQNLLLLVEHFWSSDFFLLSWPPFKKLRPQFFGNLGQNRPKLASTVKINQNHKMVTMSGANRVFLRFFLQNRLSRPFPGQRNHFQPKTNHQVPCTWWHGLFGPLWAPRGPGPVGPVGGPISQCGWTFGWNVLGTLFEGLHMGYPYIHILPLNSPPTRRYNQIFWKNFFGDRMKTYDPDCIFCDVGPKI